MIKIFHTISFRKAAVELAPFFYMAALVALLFSPYLFFGMVPSGDEDMGVYYPLMSYYQKAVESGESFLWNDFYYGGFPAYLNLFGGFLYPLHYLLFKFLPLFTAYHIAIAIAVYIGMAFSYLFGRAHSFSKTGSLVLAVGYTLGQTLGGLDTALSYACGFFVLPAMLFSLKKARESERTARYMLFLILGAVTTSSGFLAGFQQTVLYGLAFSFAYAVFLDWSSVAGASALSAVSIFGRFRAIIGFICIVGASALIASPQLIPGFLYLDTSVRTVHYTAEISERPNVLQFATLLFPDSLRIPRIVVGMSGFYIGALSFIYALYTMAFFRTPTSRFFLYSYLCMLIMVFSIPPLSWINTSLPIFSRISTVDRWLLVSVFPLSFLAAYGYEMLRTKPREWFNGRRKIFFLNAIGISSLFLMLVALGAHMGAFVIGSRPDLQEAVFNFFMRGRSLHFPYEHYRRVFTLFFREASSAISLANWKFSLPLLFFPASFFLLQRLHTRESRQWFSAATIFLTVSAIAVSFAANFDALVPRTVFLEEPAVLRAIKERERDLASFRIMTFLTGEGVFREITSRRNLSPYEQARINREIVTGQSNTFYGIQNMWGYEPLRTMRDNQLIDTVLLPNTVAVFDAREVRRGKRIDQKVNTGVFHAVSINEKLRDISARAGLLSMMNVKYIVSFYPLESSRLREVRVNPHPAIPLALHLYENLSVLPRIYFANSPLFLHGTDRELLLRVSETNDFRKETIIECGECAKNADASGKSAIIPVSRKNGEASFNVESENGGWLVLSESNIPGWVATIDSKETPIYPANYIFQAVRVPSGAHRVTFAYKGMFSLFLKKFVIF